MAKELQKTGCDSFLRLIEHIAYTVSETNTTQKTIVCAWREFELTSKSADWNVFLEVSNSRRRRTWFTHVRAAVGSNIIQVFDDKNWSCDHFWRFGMMGNLSGFLWTEI